LNFPCNEKGISLIEVMISCMLVTIGVLALLSLQAPAWNLSGRSDVLGRAGMILHKELETNEMLIMNPNVANPCAAMNPLVVQRNVFSSGQAVAQPGDIAYTVQTTTTQNVNGTWSVRVQVTWPGNNVGVSETLIVTRQEPFRF